MIAYYDTVSSDTEAIWYNLSMYVQYFCRSLKFGEIFLFGFFGSVS